MKKLNLKEEELEFLKRKLDSDLLINLNDNSKTQQKEERILKQLIKKIYSIEGVG